MKTEIKKQYLSVRFDTSTNRYTYSAPSNLKISEGDVVIVKTPSNLLKMVQVVDILTEKNVTFSLSKIKSIHGTVKEI